MSFACNAPSFHQSEPRGKAAVPLPIINESVGLLMDRIKRDEINGRPRAVFPFALGGRRWVRLGAHRWHDTNDAPRI